MTTKKQRRERVAAKTAAEREALRLENLKALKLSKDRAEQRKFEAERAEKKAVAAAKIKEIADAKQAEPLPENLKAAHDILQEVS